MFKILFITFTIEKLNFIVTSLNKKPMIQKKKTIFKINYFELINKIILKNITLYIYILTVELKYYFLVNHVLIQNNFLHVT